MSKPEVINFENATAHIQIVVLNKRIARKLKKNRSEYY